jgi:hypothetical protein
MPNNIVISSPLLAASFTGDPERRRVAASDAVGEREFNGKIRRQPRYHHIEK